MAGLAELHRPLIEPAPQPLPKSLADSLPDTSSAREMADMAGNEARPNASTDLDAFDEYDVITEADAQVRRTKPRLDGQKKPRKAERVTWAGLWCLPQTM